MKSYSTPFDGSNSTVDLFSALDSPRRLFKKMKLENYGTRWLAGIIMLAILCLIPMFTAYFNHDTFTSNNGTWAIASNLVKGRGYSGCSADYFPFCNPANQATAMREPVPVLLMAMAMLIFHSKYSGVIFQSLLYLGTIPVIYSILKKDNTPAALLAAFLWTVSIPVIREIDDDSGDLASAFFLSLGLLFFLEGYNGKKTRHWIISGIFMGMASLSRTVLLGVSLSLGLVLLIKGLKDVSRGWRKELAPALLFLVAVGFVVTPWVVRNNIVLGTPVIGSSLTGYNVFRMNFIVASDTFSPHYVGSSEGYQAVKQLIKKSNLTKMENEAQMQNFYMKAGLAIISQHPFRYLGLSVFRFMALWFNTSVKAAYGFQLNLGDYIATIQQALLLIAVMIGAVKKRKKYWPIILSLALGCGAYMAIGAQLRYLVDLMPLVVILSALAVSNLQFLRKEKSRQVSLPYLG
jgi:hypothetical protein